MILYPFQYDSWAIFWSTFLILLNCHPAAENATSTPESSPPSQPGPPPPRPSSAGSGGGGLSRFNVRKIDDPALPPPPCPPATPSDMASAAALPSSDPSAYEPISGTSGTSGNGTENSATPPSNFTPQSTVNAGKGSSRPESVCATPKGSFPI